LESGTSTSITVKLETPSTSNDKIKVEDDWSVAAKDVSINFEGTNMYKGTQSAVIELLQLSTNGVEVGLIDTDKIHLLKSRDHKFDYDDRAEYIIGDYYMLITGPDGKVVPEGSSSDLGVWIDPTDNCVKITLTSPTGDMIDFLDSGKYTVKVYYIKDITNTRIVTTPDTISFTVTDDTKEVVFKTLRSGKTSLDGTDLESVKEIVAEQMVFTIDGTVWADLDAEMIEKVTYKPIGDEYNPQYVRITAVEFNVPVSDDEENIYYYRSVVKGLKSLIRVGVEEN